MSHKEISLDDAKKKGIPFPSLSAESRDEDAKQKAEAELTQEPANVGPEKYTLEEAFFFESDPRLDLEKALLAVGFLLEWGSEIGNESFDGYAANGLSRLLQYAADQSQLLYTRDEVVEACGDPLSLPRIKAQIAAACQAHQSKKS